LDDDFDDELLIENDFSDFEDDLEALNELELDNEVLAEPDSPETIDELPAEPEKLDDVLTQTTEDSLLEQAFTDELTPQTNAEREAQLTQTNTTDQNNVISDDELDEEFMADLTQTDFDSLLNELAQPEELNVDDSSDFDVDFDSLLSEDLGENSGVDKPQNAQINEVDTSVEDAFVDIDSLLEQSDDAELEHEPYNDVNMDVGLSEFDALLAGDNPTDVDAESSGYSAKLDLARAYIEIDDFDSALNVIDEVIDKGPEDVQEEALSLKAKLK